MFGLTSEKAISWHANQSMMPVVMAVFTTTDRDNVKTAIVKQAVDGIATTTVGGQTVTIKSVDEGMRLLAVINADLAADQDHFGLRMVTLVPPGAG